MLMLGCKGLIALFLCCYLQGIGGVMMGVGFWAVTQKSDYKEFSSISTDPAAVMIAVGFFIFFISFFGTVGALRENICFLRTVSSFYVAFQVHTLTVVYIPYSTVYHSTKIFFIFMYLEDMIKVLNMYYMYFGPLKMYLWAALYTTSVAFVLPSHLDSVSFI